MLKWRKQRQTLTEVVLPFCNYQKQTEKIMSSCYFHEKLHHFYCKRALAKKSIAYNNKENFNIYFSPSNQQKKILTLLQDISNNQFLRVNSIEKQEQFSQLLSIQSSYSCAEAEVEDFSSNEIANKSISNENNFYLPSNSNFYSSTAKEPKLVVSCMVNSEDSLSSSRIGDATLDKMIDEIIESARREEKITKRVRTQSDSFEDFYEPSIHEMEVKTPPRNHLKRQKVVRRKNKYELSVPKKLNINRIGLTLSNGIASPKTPIERYPQSRTFEELIKMDTPQEMNFVVDSVTSGQGKSSTKISSKLGILANKTQSIKRRLSFSPNHIDEACTIGKYDSATSLTSTNKTSLTVKRSLDMAIFKNNGTLNVHVIRCRGLKRLNGRTDINAYVKVALLPSSLEEENENFQRTAVHKRTSRPYFNHRFQFNIRNEKNILKNLQIEVWHRDRELKRSEFLGCVSFPVQSILKSAINGCYKLQPQECLTNPISPIQLATLTADTLIGPLSQQALSSLISANTTKTIRNNKKNNKKNSNKIINSFIFGTDMAAATDHRQKSVEEDVISIDSVSASGHVIDVEIGQPIALSKKAIHQRDADENLFLRFLELDPPNEHVTSTGGSAHYRRMSIFKPTMGRTPFTVTKKLSRTADKGFGFSIVWTHPPRVEKIEPGMSADRAGIYPGDYVIFVDKHNVVTMPEADVLNLIRSQGNTLTLEIFRRTSSPGVPLFNVARSAIINGAAKPQNASAASNYAYEELSPAIKQSVGVGDPRSSTACSNASIETTKKRLHLPQVTFSKESIAPIHGVDDHRRRLLLQLVSREQNYVNALHFGIQRFVQPLNERKDLISPNDHRTLFQNIDELVRISEDILEQLIQGDHEPQFNFAARVYLSKTTAICAAYKKYCSGIKRADCVLVNKSRQPVSEFVSFITEPQVPRKRPDLTMFIHRPLQHFREILKLMQLLASHCHVDSEEHRNFILVINELQAAYREITVGGGLMEPLGEGRPLLTLQDLESRMVFTRCKPFSLAVQGRQWIFGGDLSRVEGRSIKPYWTLLFSDIIIFAKVSRDRVLFITEEPLPIANIVDSCFNIRKKTTEFRITVDPNGRLAESPTGYCAPDLTRTPKKNSKRKTLVLRAPSLELKAVWQNLLQRQIFLVNAALGSTPLSSPLDSPDVLNTLVPLNDIGAVTASMASMKISSMDSINLKNQQVRFKPKHSQMQSSYENLQRLATTLLPTKRITLQATSSTTVGTILNTTSLQNVTSNLKVLPIQNQLFGVSQNTIKTNQSGGDNSSSPWLLSLSGSSMSSNTIINSINSVSTSISNSENQNISSKSLTAIPETISEIPELTSLSNNAIESSRLNTYGNWRTNSLAHLRHTSFLYELAGLDNSNNSEKITTTTTITTHRAPNLGQIRPFLEFSLSSVGRSFIDEVDENTEDNLTNPSIATPETPTPNISPVSSSYRCPSETFSNDFVTVQVPSSPSVIVSPDKSKKKLDSVDGNNIEGESIGGSKLNISNHNKTSLGKYGGSWDLLELDLDFHQVNLDPSYNTDVEEYFFFGDDPFGILPYRPTPPDSLDL